MMVTADEVPAGGKGLKIESRLNGKVMQSDNTDNMMFPVAETIAYVTQGMTLEPGDIVFTGTPSGVGHARKLNPVLKRVESMLDDIRKIEFEITDSYLGLDRARIPAPHQGVDAFQDRGLAADKAQHDALVLDEA